MRSLCPTAASSANCGSARPTPIATICLRLDRDSRHRRFSGAVSDEFIARHAATANEFGVVVHGFFVDGMLRGAAELRRFGSAFRARGGSRLQHRAALAEPWRRHRAARTHAACRARNRGIKSLHMHCLADNRRMQQLARKFDADLTFDFGSVVGEVDAAALDAAVADARGAWPTPTASPPRFSTRSRGCCGRRSSSALSG